MISQILPAYKYLVQERKLTDSTILAWHLGYCDFQGEVYIDADFQSTLPALPQTMRHSTLFPIYDLYGQVVSVSARPLGFSKIKYVNTSYEKADHLYGLHLNYKEILRTQKVYVAEGNLSMITPWQHGLKNVVALLGINISHTQLCLLNRFAKQVVFMVDADKAGENFIEKMRQQIPSRFYDTDMKFSFVQLPFKQDPDSYFQDHSLEEFNALPEEELVL
jgi:DNA primase